MPLPIASDTSGSFRAIVPGAVTALRAEEQFVG